MIVLGLYPDWGIELAAKELTSPICDQPIPALVFHLGHERPMAQFLEIREF